MSVGLDRLEELAMMIHEDMYHQIGENLCVTSEKHMGILVFDKEGNIRFAWCINEGVI